EHRPIGLEGFDDIMVAASRRKSVNLDALAMLPEGAGWLMVEFGANTAAEAESQARSLMEALERSSGAAHMGCSRIEPRRNFACPRRAVALGRLRGFRRRARKTWRVSARAAPFN